MLLVEIVHLILGGVEVVSLPLLRGGLGPLDLLLRSSFSLAAPGSGRHDLVALHLIF